MIFNKNTVSKLILGVLALSITACMKTFTLPNGITRVPTKTEIYENQGKFNKSLLDVIDTDVIYESFDKYRNIPERLETQSGRNVYSAFRFYQDGRLNKFILDSNKPLELNDFNPKLTGYRGVYYSEKGKIRYDLFAPSNELRWIGKLTGTFTFSGDTLYVRRDETKKEVDIYIKRELPPGYLDYKAYW